VKVRPISAVFWTKVGRVAVSIAAVSVAAAMIDGVMAMLMILVAMLVGGISGVGVNATARFGTITLIVGVSLAVVMTHYVVSTGLMAPTATTLIQTFKLIAIPLSMSAGLLIWGLIKRKRKAISS